MLLGELLDLEGLLVVLEDEFLGFDGELVVLRREELHVVFQRLEVLLVQDVGVLFQLRSALDHLVVGLFELRADLSDVVAPLLHHS